MIARLTFDNLRGDFYGGVTAAVVALPLALAFGVASGAGPVAGIYGARISVSSANNEHAAAATLS